MIKVCLDFLETNIRVMLRHICTPEMYLSITGAQMWPKVTDKPSKNNRRIGDWIHEEISMQATLQNNYYKARNISNYVITDV